MNLVEITVDATKISDEYVFLAIKVERENGTTEICRKYPRKGSIMFPLLHAFIEEIKPLEDSAVVLFSNVRRLKSYFREFDDQQGELAREIRKLEKKNNLTILTDRVCSDIPVRKTIKHKKGKFK